MSDLNWISNIMDTISAEPMLLAALKTMAIKHGQDDTIPSTLDSNQTPLESKVIEMLNYNSQTVKTALQLTFEFDNQPVEIVIVNTNFAALGNYGEYYGIQIGDDLDADTTQYHGGICVINSKERALEFFNEELVGQRLN